MASLAAAIVAGVGAARYTLGGPGHAAVAAANSTPAPPNSLVAEPGVMPVRALLPPPPPTSRVPLPGNGVLTVLPGGSDLLALTVDDGVNSDVVRLYTQFAKDTGIRMTYFVNGMYRSWTEHAELLRPLVEAGQIQLGNHTWSHPDLTTVSMSRIADEITRNSKFLKTSYGVDARPYLRPPYGKYNRAVAACAADLGYTVNTLWSGSLSDSTVVTEDYIVKMATQYFKPQTIVIGHLNHMPVTRVYGRLVEIIRDRNLRTVTLKDVFA
jgi:peptidoglycan-N-acetylglucosamine deacetylase